MEITYHNIKWRYTNRWEMLIEEQFPSDLNGNVKTVKTWCKVVSDENIKILNNIAREQKLERICNDRETETM